MTISRRTASALAAFGLLAGVLAGSALAKKPASGTTVRAVIWPNNLVTIAPKSARMGSVVLTVKNRDTAPQQLQINGVESKLIEPGSSVTMTVTFQKPGLYSIALPDQSQSYANDYARNATRLKITK